MTDVPVIPQKTREAIRQAQADLGRAVERAENVTRPDGTDGHGHPGIAAANLEGYLGRFTVPLLDALEDCEAKLAAAPVTTHVHCWDATGSFDTGHMPPRQKWQCECGAEEWTDSPEGPLGC